MQLRLGLRKGEKELLFNHLHRAYKTGSLRLVKRIQAILFLVDGKSVSEVALMLALSEQTIYNYICAFLHRRLESLAYKRPSGRPPRLTQSQKKELCKIIDGGPEAAGYDSGCWDSSLIQDWLLTQFGVEYTPQYIAQLLKNLGYSYQRAKFVSDHLENVKAKQETWMKQEWPEIMQLAAEKKAMVLFGDEASFAQWGSLSRTWAKRGQQPTVKTSGKRKSYKVFGLIDYFSGQFFAKSHQGRFNSDSYQAFLLDVLQKTSQHLILIHDRAPYHTSKAMNEFYHQHLDRLTVRPLPPYSPEFNPIEHLWKNIKKKATHLRYFPTFETLTNKVDEKLQLFATLPESIINLMGKYCKSLGQETI